MVKDFFKKKIGKVLLFIITVSFVLSSIGGVMFFSNKYNVIVVNGKKINYRKFSKLLAKEREAAYLNGERDIEYIISKDFTLKTLEKIKNSELLEVYVDDNNMLAEKNMVFKTIVENKSFYTNGEFNKEKYTKYLRDMNISEEDYIKSMQYSFSNVLLFRMLGVDMNFSSKTLKNLIDNNNKYKIVNLYEVNKKDINLNSFDISVEEARKYYNDNIKIFTHDEERKVDFIKIDLTRNNKEVTDKDIDDFYNNNKSKYDLPETFNIYYLESDKESDLERIVSNKDNLLAGIKNILGKNEKDVLMENLPSLALVYIFGEGADKVQINDFHKIVKSGDRFITFYLKGRNEPKVITKEEARESIITELQRDGSQEAIKANYDRAQILFSKSKNLEDISKEFGNVKTESLGYIKYNNDKIAELKANKDMIFSSNQGNFIPAFSGNNYYYVYFISDIKKSYADRFDDIKSNVIDIIKKEKEKELYLSKVSINDKEKYKVFKNLLIKKSDKKYDRQFIQDIYRININSFTKIYQDNDKLYFAEIIDEKDIDKNDINFIDYERIAVSLNNDVNIELGNYYMRYLSEKYKVFVNTDLLKYF